MQSLLRCCRRHAAAALMACTATFLVGCGGGGDSADSPALASESATSYASGPISGFGSVIVNGVRYDDSSATVLDDDDGGRSRDELKLGMMVEVDGAQMNRAAAQGRALRIRFGSEIVGPVGSVDASTGTLVVLGQTVRITSTTVFDDSLVGGLAALTAGTVVEVHALFDAASGSYIATRIEDEDNTSFYKLRGLIANLDTAAKTFTIGSEVINYAGLTVADLPGVLADGQRVRVRLQTAQVAGQWVAVALRPGVRKIEDREEAHLRGAITALTSTAAFEVNGLPVDAASANFPDGSAGVVLGAQVEVEGKVVNGVLVATKVELDARHAGERHGFELHGAISALDAATRSFTLRSVRISYGVGTVFRDGSAADLADGRQVEVKGTPSSDRTTLQASRIDFED
jgi:Domain of unknown function (DUF5666)